MDNKKRDIAKPGDTKKRVIQLDDLDWEDEVVGGSSGGKIVFGEQPGSENPFDRPSGQGKPSTSRGGF